MKYGKIKRGILAADIFLIAIVCVFLVRKEEKLLSDDCFLCVPVLRASSWEMLCGSRQEEALDYQIYFDGAALPRYASRLGEGYLISQAAREEWTGRITVSDGYEIAFPESEDWNDLGSVIREMKPLPFIVYNRSSYCQSNLYVTSLPVMALETESTETEEGRECFYGEMRLFYSGGGESSQAIVSDCEFHVRGAASRVYYKMSYKLNLLGRNRKNRKLELLGMRSDDDWILRSLGLDESKIREKLAIDLWNEMNTFGRYQSNYVELFLDGVYQGLYLLQEPMDFKTLKVSPEDYFLVQTKVWAEDADFWEDVENLEKMQLQCGEFVVDKSHAENLEEVYDILTEYKLLMAGEGSGKIHLDFDRENLYKLDVLLMAIAGVDNTSKNQFLVFERTGENTYGVRKLPWDMDASFGQMLDYCVYEAFSELETADETVQRLMETEPEETAQGRQEMYRSLRDTVLQEGHVLYHIEKLYAAVQNSGALSRENAAWDKQFGREQTEFIEEFVVRRLEWLDEYYSQL